ncbi:MAG: hypothetical protein ISS19_08215 [Bacteroidales bacterium]|nr:hypothetical protein [Bacteroidales bacterium]
MVKGTKIYQRIPDRYLDFLKLLEDQEISVFSLDQACRWTHRSNSEMQEMLQNLSRKGMIERLERRKYARYGFRNDKVIGTFIADNSVIGYWSALNLHGMTEQIPNVVFVQSPRLKRPATIFNVRYRFVHILPEKIFGITQFGYGNEAFPVTDKEKTLLDCFNMPVYTAGYDTLILAFYHGDLQPGKLLDYGKRLGNLSVLKRLAFLSEVFRMSGYRPFRDTVASMLNDRYTPLDPMGPFEGEFVSTWKIRLNISRSQLLELIQ